MYYRPGALPGLTPPTTYHRSAQDILLRVTVVRLNGNTFWPTSGHMGSVFFFFFFYERLADSKNQFFNEQSKSCVTAASTFTVYRNVCDSGAVEQAVAQDRC